MAQYKPYFRWKDEGKGKKPCLTSWQFWSSCNEIVCCCLQPSLIHGVCEVERRRRRRGEEEDRNIWLNMSWWNLCFKVSFLKPLIPDGPLFLVPPNISDATHTDLCSHRKCPLGRCLVTIIQLLVKLFHQGQNLCIQNFLQLLGKTSPWKRDTYHMLTSPLFDKTF